VRPQGRLPSDHPALDLRSPSLIPGSTPHDRLLVLLDDLDPAAIEEDTGWCRVFFGSEAARDRAAAMIAAAGLIDDLNISRIEIPDENWAERSQAGLPAVRVGRIVVAPPWDRPPEVDASDALIIDIVPSTGFGTGHHESTRLALQALQALDLAGCRLIDAGTGSGVLSIAASRLGAASVLAIDSDPDALDSARTNLARNPLAGGIELGLSAIESVRAEPADVVVANLTGTLLVRHADALTHLVRPGGALVAAGFTISDEPSVLFHLAGERRVVSRLQENDWIALVIQAGARRLGAPVRFRPTEAGGRPRRQPERHPRARSAGPG
jgi:ribosomal protein L11 methyltransferase